VGVGRHDDRPGGEGLGQATGIAGGGLDEGDIGIGGRLLRLHGIRPTTVTEGQAPVQSCIGVGVVVSGQTDQGYGAASVFEALAKGNDDGGLATEGLWGDDEERVHDLVKYSTSGSVTEPAPGG
jgi:hypothetical protein